MSDKAQAVIDRLLDDDIDENYGGLWGGNSGHPKKSKGKKENSCKDCDCDPCTCD